MTAVDEAKPGEGDIVERIEYTEGILVYLKGHPYPFKGLPTVPAIDGVNRVKRLIKDTLRHPWKIVSFIALSYPHIHTLEPQFMTPCAREVLYMLWPLNKKLAVIVSHVLEYDGAYRFRFQDSMSEVTKEELLRYPHATLLKLIELNRQRDYTIVSRKIAMLIPFTYLVCLPLFRGMYKRMIMNCNLPALQFDDNDRYWASLKKDYNYFGV